MLVFWDVRLFVSETKFNQEVEMRVCHWTLAVGDDAGLDARVAKWRFMVALAPPLRIRLLPTPPLLRSFLRWL
jgi:hypothetical protein